MRAVVVGASSGLGRCIATSLGQNGAQLAIMARRLDRLVDAAKEAGPGTLAIACDVTDEASCKSAVDEAAQGLGGIDALLYTPGVGPLARIEDVGPDTWRYAFDTNVIGASLITAAAIPHLAASKGVVAYLSSVAGSLTPPWPGLGAYAVTKAALNTLIEAWRGEHPEVGFTQVIVGDCAGGEGPAMTEFANAWDWNLAAQLHPTWQARGLLAGSLVDVKELARVVETVLSCGATACIPTVAVVPRPGQGPTPEMPTPEGPTPEMPSV